MTDNEKSVQYVWGLELSTRARNVLISIGVANDDDLLKVRAEDLMYVPGVGRKTINMIKDAQSIIKARRLPAEMEYELTLLIRKVNFLCERLPTHHLYLAGRKLRLMKEVPTP